MVFSPLYGMLPLPLMLVGGCCIVSLCVAVPGVTVIIFGTFLHLCCFGGCSFTVSLLSIAISLCLCCFVCTVFTVYILRCKKCCNGLDHCLALLLIGGRSFIFSAFYCL